MPIELTCEHCGKRVRTSDEHAGKRGRCPYCKNEVYIPSPDVALEPLKLAPVDQKEEAERQRLLDETKRISHAIRADRTEVPEGTAGRAPAKAVDVEEAVISYAVAMAAGELEKAERLAGMLHDNFEAAEQVIQRITADDIPPARLKNIPRAVLVGFFKQLRS